MNSPAIITEPSHDNTAVSKNFTWQNLPAQLKKLDQWCVSVLPDKAPKIYDDQKQALVNTSVESGPFHTFTDVCRIASDHSCAIGFVFLKENGLGVIDFDVTDATKTNDESKWTSKEDLDFFASTVEISDTYCELSVNGQGVHIIGAYSGVEQLGKRGNHREIYNDKRYMICTGDALSQLTYVNCFGRVVPYVENKKAKDITDQTRLFDLVLKTIRPNQDTQKIELVELAPEYTDDQIWQMATSAANKDNFLRLFGGDKSGHPSYSEADLALMSMLAFYSNSNAQCKRIFRHSKLNLITRPKITKNDVYLNNTLKLTRTTHAQETQLQVSIDLQSMAATDKARTNEENKIKIESETQFEFPSGLAGEIAQFIYDQAYYPIKQVAVCAALGLLSGVFGKAFATPTDAGLNNYIILIAKSGVGKDAMHSGINILVDRLSDNLLLSAAPDFVSLMVPVSPNGLLKSLESKHSVLNLHSEFGQTISLLVKKGGSTNDKGLLKIITQLYSQSGVSGKSGGLAYSDTDKNVEVKNVSYSLLGETTPFTLNTAITQEILADGFMSRFLMIEYDGDRPEPNKHRAEPTEQLIQRMKELVGLAANQQINSPHTRVQYNSTSEKILVDFRKDCDRKLVEAGEEESLRQLYTRSHLKALKIASLLAAADNPHNPIIEQHHADYAIKLVADHTAMFLRKLESGDIGDGDDVRAKKIMDICKKLVSGKYSRSVKKEYWSDGIIPRRALVDLAKSTSFKNYRHGQTLAIDHTVRSLIDSGLLTDCTKDVQKRFSVSGSFYKLLE